MAKLLQLRGGTTSQHSSFTGAVREVTVDTDKDTLVVHDGSTQGGFPLPRTGAEIAALLPNDSIDSQHYAAGSIDLEHLSSESVDEDNLYVSNAGSNGQFLQKQSGNNGGLTWATVDTSIADDSIAEEKLDISNTASDGQFLQYKDSSDKLTWATVSTPVYVPSGSVMAFFQASAPTGWTQVTSQNDKVLRVVSGTGGGTGGDWAVSAGETTSSHGGHTHSGAAHSHNHNLSAGAHTLSESEMPSHSHRGYGHRNQWNSQYGIGNKSYLQSAHVNNSVPLTSTGGSSSHSHGLSGSITSGGDGNTGSGGSHTHTIDAPQYIDVIICSKD